MATRGGSMVAFAGCMTVYDGMISTQGDELGLPLPKPNRGQQESRAWHVQHLPQEWPKSIWHWSTLLKTQELPSFSNICPNITEVQKWIKNRSCIYLPKVIFHSQLLNYQRGIPYGSIWKIICQPYSMENMVMESSLRLTRVSSIFRIYDDIYSQPYGGFHSHGATPIAACFRMDNPI